MCDIPQEGVIVLALAGTTRSRRRTPQSKVIQVIQDEVDLTEPRAERLLQCDITCGKVAQSLFDRRKALAIQGLLDDITGGRCARMQLSWLRDTLRQLARESLA